MKATPQKLLLISINKSWKFSNVGVDMIAGYLRDMNYFVDIAYFHQGETLEEINERIRSEYADYDIYGCSVYSSNVEWFCKITKEIKTFEGERVIVWGGAFPSMYYKCLLADCPEIDYVILGDGEKPFEHLLSHLNQNDVIIAHPSIVSAESIEGKVNACNGVIYNLPAWDYYEKINPQMNVAKTHCIQSKNNVCTGNCSFCYERKGRIAYKPIQLIVSELQYVSDHFGVRKIFFSDDNLLDPNTFAAKERVRRLCTEIIRLNRKFAFSCYIKAISFEDTDYDNDLLALMAKAGFSTIFIGIESGNESDLMLYRKHTTVADNIRIIKLLEKHDIVPQIGFINFNPYSTQEKLKQNYYFLTQVRSNNLYSYVCTFLNLYEGTRLFEQVKRDGLLKPDYTILNDMAYCFQDPDANMIASFVKEYMYDRVRKLPYETGWLLQRCEAAIRINPLAKKCKTCLLEMKEKELPVIRQFFFKLFVDADIEYCKANVDEFLSFFEGQRDVLEKIFLQIQEYAEG